MHGADGLDRGWAAPLLTMQCDEEARPGYKSMKAHEYRDDVSTLHDKVRHLASMIRESRHFVTYTGAGISTASGINDYASKGKSAAKANAAKAKVRAGGRVSGLEARPTLAHHTLAALHHAGYLFSRITMGSHRRYLAFFMAWFNSGDEITSAKVAFRRTCRRVIHSSH